MSKTSNFFKTSYNSHTALLSLLGACAIDDPIDYTTATEVPTSLPGSSNSGTTNPDPAPQTSNDSEQVSPAM